MRKIKLICSLHGENGLCTADELLKLIRAIDPEVIFGEVPTADRDFYDPRSLEGQAVARFLALKPSCKCVRVDQYAVSPNFHAIMNEVFDYVDDVNQEYRRLFELRHHASHQMGFAYLNSAAFTELMARMVEIENETINRSGNPALAHGLAVWRETMHGRERAMLANRGAKRLCQCSRTPVPRRMNDLSSLG